MTIEIYKYYLKSKICIIMSILLFAITYGFTIYFSSLGMTGFSLIHTVARFNFYVCFFIVCLTYYYVSSANRNYVKEVSEVVGYKAIYEINAVSVIMFQTLLWNIGMCLIIIACSIKNDGSNYFISWFPENYLCNIIIPQIICIIITFFVSTSWNSSRWLMFEILFLFLISPFSEEIIWEQKPLMPIDSLWKNLHRPFEILYQNGKWSADFQNDLQIERVRIYILLFWLLLLFCIGTIYWKKRKIVSILAGLGAMTFLILLYQPASVYRLNASWDGVNKDYTDYAMHINDNTYKPLDTQSFSIQSYNLELSFENELSVRGSIEIKAQQKCEEFDLTLYHGYSVNDIVSQTKGVEIKFKQYGDNLCIETSKKVTELKCYINYKGHHNKFYSNSRAAMLPGWFPWYPMEGKRQIVIEYPEYGRMWGYNPYNRIPKAKVCIKSNIELITNLMVTENNVYEGVVDSITVLSGNLKKIQDEILVNYLPLELHSEYVLGDFIETQKQNYYDSLNKLKNVFGIDVSEFEGKQIIFASKDIGRNTTNNFISVFDEYILAVPDYITVNDLLHYMILKDYENRDKREQSVMIQMFLNSFFDDNPESIIRSWIDEIELRKEHPEYFDQVLDNQELLLDILEKCDYETMVREVVQYILHPENYENDKEFLEKMRAGL